MLCILFYQALGWASINMPLWIVCMPSDILDGLVYFYCGAWPGWALQVRGRHIRAGIKWELTETLLYLPECRLQTTAQLLRAGENPCPSRPAVRQRAGNLEVHQRGRGWEVT